MKKRLLITSIVMMLVVAVALSTATYAWFTSNASVTASSITFTAATNEDDAIAIGWAGGPYGTTALAATTNGANMAPMIPNEIVVGQTTIDAGDNQISFITAKIETVNSDTVFKSVGSATPLKWQTNDNGADPSAAADMFFIKNTSSHNIVQNIKIKAEITPNYIACSATELAVPGYTYYGRTGQGTDQSPYVYEALQTQPTTGNAVGEGVYKATTDLVRVAVFTRDLDEDGTSDSESSYYLRGILASAAGLRTYFGTNTEETGTVRNGLSQSTYHDTSTNYNTITTAAIDAEHTGNGFNICKTNGSDAVLAANGVVEVKVLIWLDGEALNDNTQGAIANVKLIFDAV